MSAPSAAGASSPTAAPPFFPILDADVPMTRPQCQRQLIDVLWKLHLSVEYNTPLYAQAHMHALFRTQRCDSVLKPSVAAARADMARELGVERARRLALDLGRGATREDKEAALLATLNLAYEQRQQLQAALDWQSVMKLRVDDRLERLRKTIIALDCVFDPTPRF